MGLLRNRLLFLFLAVALLLLFFLDLGIGSAFLGWKEIWDILLGDPGNEFGKKILMEIRIPRVVTAIVAGMALSSAGLQMQTMFRNPLAGPYVLGLSSGAGLGVALLVLGMPFLGKSFLYLPSSLSVLLAASAGAGLVMLIMLILSFRVRDVLTLLILGILLGSALSAIVSILQYFTNESALRLFVIWTMGSLGGVSSSQLMILVPAVIFGCILAQLAVKMLNGFLLGEEEAKSLGVHILLARILVFVSTSVLAGAVTAFCGPIGFVGVAVPHLARMLFGTSNHKILMPAVFLIGAVMMLLSDLLTQLPGNGIILPVNAVTSLLGIPVIIWILLRSSVAAK